MPVSYTHLVTLCGTFDYSVRFHPNPIRFAHIEN